MKFVMKNLLKKLDILLLGISLCVTSVGMTSVASSLNSQENIVNDNVLLGEEFLQESLVDNSNLIINNYDESFLEGKQEVELLEKIDNSISEWDIGIASASNAFNSIVVVTTADELEVAIGIAEDGSIIEIANDIYLSQTLLLDKDITIKAVDGMDKISIYSNNDSRHFVVNGDEIHLTMDNVILDGNGLSGGIQTNATHLILSGAIIQNCMAHPINNASSSYGGGIYAFGRLTIVDSNIFQNRATYGGGIYTTMDVKIYQSIISKNEGNSGGGIYVSGNINTYRVVDIFESTISHNSTVNASTNSGGGAYIYGAILCIENSQFLDNSTLQYGGGLYLVRCETSKISNSLFFDNIAENSNNISAPGGAAYIASSNMEIVECEFIGNYASTGGALQLSGSMVYIYDSRFIDNTAKSYGGALNINHSSTDILNCNFTNNKANSGAGIYVYLTNDTTNKVTNSKMSENITTSMGGAISVVRYTTSYEPVPLIDVFHISNCEITNNTASSGGGIGSNSDSRNLIKYVKIDNGSIIKNNFSHSAQRMTNENDIAIHNQLIDSTVTWTDGFDYIYNNIDVQYNGSVSLTVYKINISESHEDDERTNSYPVIRSDKFQYHFTIPEGYEAIIESNVDLDVNLEAGTIDIASVTNNVDIQITYIPKVEEELYTVTLITHYLDGVKEDEVKSYIVKAGDSFEQVYDVLEGYEFAGISTRFSYPIIDGDAKTVHIDNVNEDFLITIKLARKSFSVKITTSYMDGMLLDETKTYSVLYGDDFAEAYEALEGYTFVGIGVRSLPYVDGDAQMVYIDGVKENYEIVIKLDRREHTVMIIVQYPEGTIENQVSTYSVLYGDSLNEHFTVESGYRIAAIQVDKGIDVDFQSQMVEIEKVTKDMLITIICR